MLLDQLFPSALLDLETSVFFFYVHFSSYMTISSLKEEMLVLQ